MPRTPELPDSPSEEPPFPEALRAMLAMRGLSGLSIYRIARPGYRARWRAAAYVVGGSAQSETVYFGYNTPTSKWIQDVEGQPGDVML